MSIFSLRIVPREGRYSCHACVKEGDGKHFELWDWCRYLCFDCADTVGRKLVELAKIGPDLTPKPKEADLFAEPRR